MASMNYFLNVACCNVYYNMSISITPQYNWNSVKVGVKHWSINHSLCFSIPRFKQRVALYVPEYGNMHALLDAVKVADSVLFLLSPDGGSDDFGDYCLTCLFGQGMPATTFGVQVGFKQSFNWKWK